MIKIGWIDFSSEDREKAMSVIDLMKDKGAVDELGIGTIRDRLADLLFPGSSTIQTRAKYFFIIPWCMMEAEKNYKNKKMFIKKLNDLETKVISRLIEVEDDNVKGIIGKVSKENLKRKPSSIYWNGMKTYGIMPLQLSLNQYIDTIEYRNVRGKRFREDDGFGDDKDSGFLEGNNIRWGTIKPEIGWINELRLSLSNEEAIYLKNAIIRSNPKSLYSIILNDYLDIIQHEDDIYDLSFKDKLPKGIQDVLQLAIDFSNLIHGAHLRFNIILYNKNLKTNNEYDGSWKQWCREMENFHWKSFDEVKLFALTNIPEDTKLFVQAWIKIARNINNIDLEYIDRLIENREFNIKGGRAKIKNYSKVNIDEWVGLNRLNYRWNNVKTILKDIYEGGYKNA